MTVTSNGVLAVDAGATLNVNGNVSIANTTTLAGTMTVSNTNATITTGDLMITGGSFSLLNGQTMTVHGTGAWPPPDGAGLRMGAGSQFTMSGGSLVVGASGLGEFSIGDGSIPGTSGPAVFTMSGGTIRAGIFGTEGPNGNIMGLSVGQEGATGIFNQEGGLVVVHGFGYFALGGDPWYDTPGTGTYNLSGGTLNTSEGGQPTTWSGNWGKYTAIGMGGTGTMNVSGSGLWVVADDNTARPIMIGCGTQVGDPGGNGTVNITGGTVQAGAGVMVGDVFQIGGATGLLNLNGGLLDVQGQPIVVGLSGTFTTNSGTLQNVGEFYGNNATVNQSTGAITSAPTPLVKSGPGTLVVAGVNTYTAGTIITGGTLALGAAPRRSPCSR